jgi:hypothetical protein
MAKQTIPFQAERWMERSALVRFPSSQAVYCQPMPTSDELSNGWWGELRNISSGGLAVRLSRPFEPGMLLIIELPDKTRRYIRSIPVQVVHSTAEGNRLWIVGCEFIRLLDEEELKALVG